jgi:hypothetical protein
MKCTDLGAWRFPAHLLGNGNFRCAQTGSPLLPQLASSLLSISNAVGPGVAGCLGNESLVRVEEAH